MFLGRIGELVAIDNDTLNNPFETTDNRGRNIMGLLQRASVGSRRLAVVFGVLLRRGIVSLPGAWSPVAADDQSSLGAGVYPAAYAITGAKIVTAPGKSIDPGTIVVRRGIIEAVGPDQGRDGPLRRRDDRRQGAGRLPGIHRPVHDGRPARRRRAVGDRQGPAGRPGRGALDLDAARQPQGLDARV